MLKFSIGFQFEPSRRCVSEREKGMFQNGKRTCCGRARPAEVIGFCLSNMQICQWRFCSRRRLMCARVGKIQGPVVQKGIKVNLGLNNTEPSLNFAGLKSPKDVI